MRGKEYGEYGKGIRQQGHCRRCHKIALTKDRAEEKQLQQELARLGIRTAAVDYGGEFINSVMKIIERAVVSSREKASYRKATWRRAPLRERPKRCPR